MGSNVGTDCEVATSATAATPITVVIARVMAATVLPMGTLSDEASVAGLAADDDAVEASPVAVAVAFFTLDASKVDLPR